MSPELAYLILIIVLFALAITDLIVGVSNDAVNFLISAFGSKAGSLKTILAVASLGVFVGAIFSNGMMEVARKGIFHPEQFVFSEIILIFVAVMLTDIILLDFFNTFGFPTSTTVSLVFGLLGSAVAISLIKIAHLHTGNVGDYINSGRAFLIISGILLSIIVAFTIGAIVQYIARLIFTFQYEKNYKYFGSIWAGFAFAVIITFMFIKGFKNSAIADASWVQWILHHKAQVIIYSFIFFTIFFEILKSFFHVNVLKIVVLAGTFALAMAWAGNDLVNFIGVPLAGYSSYTYWVHSGVSPDQYSMAALSGKVHVPLYFFIGAGIVISLTLWMSKKARTVIQTSVDLSRQESGYERFGSSPIARALVRVWIKSVQAVNSITPAPVRKWVSQRFNNTNNNTHINKVPRGAAFDLIRASVNLVVSSALIAIATSYKLPLSTTYVTFMVAMGTSLADRAWGRESAVYRVTGVISVIGGWFLTAFIAFSIAAIIATIIYFGGGIAIALMVLFEVYLIYHSTRIHRRRVAKEEEEKRLKELEADITPENVFDRTKETILRELKKVPDIMEITKNGFLSADRRKLKEAVQIAESLKDNTKHIKKDIFRVIHALREDMVGAAQYYVQEVDHLREIANAAVYFSRRMLEHIENNHELFSEEQMKDFEQTYNLVKTFIDEVINIIVNDEFHKINHMREWKNEILKELEDAKTAEIQRIQNEEVDILSSNLLLNVIAEFKNLVLFFNRALKAHKRFYIHKKALEQPIITT